MDGWTTHLRLMCYFIIYLFFILVETVVGQFCVFFSKFQTNSYVLISIFFLQNMGVYNVSDYSLN